MAANAEKYFQRAARMGRRSAVPLLRASSRRHAFHRRVFPVQRLARTAAVKGAVGGACGLCEAGEDEFQLARISGDVADGVETRLDGLAGGGIDGDLLALESDAPLGDGTEAGRKAEKREQHI